MVGAVFHFCSTMNGRKIFPFCTLIVLFFICGGSFQYVWMVSLWFFFFSSPVLFFVVNLVPVSAYLSLATFDLFLSISLLSSLSMLAIVFSLCSFMNFLLFLISTLWTWFAAVVVFLQPFTHVQHRCKILPFSFTLLVNVSSRERRTCPSQSESADFQECHIRMSKTCVTHWSLLIHVPSLTNTLMLLFHSAVFHSSQWFL